jgi:hypothetical protein
LASTLAHAYHYCMATWLYDLWSQPLYPYTKASSAYSAMVQLYAHSGQLLTASNMKQKKQTGDSAWRYCKGNLAVLRLITQASKGGSKENI